MNQSPPMQDIQALVGAYRRQLGSRRQRGLVVLDGARDWVRQTALACLSMAGEALWLGREIPDGIEGGEAATALRHLGRECGDVVLDARDGFDADALGAISGSLRSGHLLFLLTPSFESWPDYEDPELARINVEPFSLPQVGRRFVRLCMQTLNESGMVLRISEQGQLPAMPELPEPGPQAETVPPPYCSLEQQQAVEAVLKVVHGHRRRPLVLSSDRGRGKSSALGLAAARLLAEGKQRLIITGPGLGGVAMAFERAAALLPEAELGPGRLYYRGAELVYMPADELLRQRPLADLLMVDEAAAIPVAMLRAMLRHYSRITYATTVHGYEGTGRGFELRFKPVLDRQAPDWRELRLTVPIRWAPDDPLEHIVNRLLFLDAEPARLEAPAGTDSSWNIEHLSRDKLLSDRPLLAQIFGLLVNAHYRTRPYDLRHMLDAPNLELFVMRQSDKVIAVLLGLHEGNVGQGLREDIFGGRRRLHGHLLPQSLLAHGGETRALDFRYLRIMRIAVHAQYRRHGIGTALVDHLGNWARERGLDMLGCSYGADPDLLQFWSGLGLQAVRIGFRREASSGSHAVMMMQPLNLGAEAYFQGLRERFVQDLPYLLTEPLRELDAGLVPYLLCQHKRLALEPHIRQSIEDFIEARRDYEVSLPDLWRFLAQAISACDCEGISGLIAEYEFIIKKVWQGHDFKSLSDEYGINGRREIVKRLRQCCRTLLAHIEF